MNRRRGDVRFSAGPRRPHVLQQRLQESDRLQVWHGGRRIPEYINIDRSEAKGWELEGGLQRPVHGFTVGGSYSYVDTEVVTNQSTSQQFQPGQPLLRRPRNSGFIRAAYSASRATVSFDLRMVGDRHDSSFLFLRSVPNAQYPTAFTTDITVNPGYTVAGLGLECASIEC